MNILRVIFPNKPWLFKKKMNDSFFGLMWFNNKDKNSESHFQCQIMFSHTNAPLDIFIDSDVNGLNPNQKILFFEFEKRYEEILESIKPHLVGRLNKVKFNENLNLDMKSDFHIWSLVIFSIDSDNQFSIGLSSDKYKISNIRLNIKDFKFREFIN